MFAEFVIYNVVQGDTRRMKSVRRVRQAAKADSTFGTDHGLNTRPYLLDATAATS